MLTRLDHIRCPAILSVRTIRPADRCALVVTPSPTLARVIGDHLRTIDGALAVIWLPTISSARRRLEANPAELVVVDETLPSSDELMDAIHASSPETNIVALAGGK